MRSSLLPCCGAAIVCGLLSTGLPARAAAQSASEQRAGDTAAELVCEALRAEASGETSRRAELLERALRRQPDYAAAHWHRGEVRVAGRWVSVETATEAAARAGQVEVYRRLRDRVRPTAKEHLALAQWCAEHKLADQERLHLLVALRLAPNLQEVIKKLDLTRRHGTLVSRPQAAAIDQSEKQTAAALAAWKPRLVKLRTDMESDRAAKQADARQKLLAIDDPTLIPALESIFADSTVEAANAVVATLEAIPAQAAADSLARHAVFAPDARVRNAAAAALRSRSPFSYVPTLMQALQSPVNVQFDQFFENGHCMHRLALFQRGLFNDRSLVSAGGTSTDITLSKRYGNSIHFTPDPTLARDALLAQQAEEANAAKNELNGRITAALRTATGNELEADPMAWWNWWLDYNEIYRPSERSVSETVYYNPPSPNQIRVASCFVAGTKVWTSTGTMPIEQIQIGECVLAQDVETGELAYRPVLDTTVRPPSPLVEISAGGETISATRGHPFWVSGMGWQMAKELKAGQWLHTPRGPLMIESVGRGESAECFNLVVADFGTYFITDRQVLVHDNNLRQVTTATVPGLMQP